MSSYQVGWMIVLLPVVLLYGVLELMRGWKILARGEPSLNVALQIRIWILRLVLGSRESDAYKDRLLSDPRTMRLRGVYSLAAGILCIAGSVLWAYLLWTQLLTE